MKIDVLDINGKTTGRSVELPAEIFGVEPNNHAVYLAVKQYQAAQRQGTHKAKEKGEITASTKKIKKQKGTGGARAGSLKSPLFKGGGRVFGPRPRNYDLRLNKKLKTIAKQSALSFKAANGSIMVVQDFNLDTPKTKDFVSVLNSLNLGADKSLFVMGDYNKNVYLSGRNLPNSGVINAKDLNIVDILRANTLVLSESSLEVLKSVMA